MLAPEATTMEFWPYGSTVMSATPVGRERIACMKVTSTPAAERLAFK